MGNMNSWMLIAYPYTVIDYLKAYGTSERLKDVAASDLEQKFNQTHSPGEGSEGATWMAVS